MLDVMVGLTGAAVVQMSKERQAATVQKLVRPDVMVRSARAEGGKPMSKESTREVVQRLVMRSDVMVRFARAASGQSMSRELKAEVVQKLVMRPDVTVMRMRATGVQSMSKERT